MNATEIASILVTLIAAGAAAMAGRSANKASTRNTEIQSRTSLETEAYNRARKYDMDTITRQENEIAALRESNRILNAVLMTNAELKNENESLKAEVQRLRRRVRRLEAINPDIDEVDEDEEENPSEQHSGGP